MYILYLNISEDLALNLLPELGIDVKVCECVCDREKERERERYIHLYYT